MFEHFDYWMWQMIDCSDLRPLPTEEGRSVMQGKKAETHQQGPDVAETLVQRGDIADQSHEAMGKVQPLG